MTLSLAAHAILACRHRARVLPTVFSVGLIHQVSPATPTDQPLLPPFCDRHPAVAFASYDVAQRRELETVTPSTRTANLERLGAPYLVMMLGVPHQCVGNLMKHRVCDFLFRRSFREFVRQGNDPGCIVTTASSFRAIVELETPLMEVMPGQQGSRGLSNGGYGFRRMEGVRYDRMHLVVLQEAIRHAIFFSIVRRHLASGRIDADQDAVYHHPA
jgi:hypothetical protein